MSPKEALLERINQLPEDQLAKVAAYVAELTAPKAAPLHWPKLLTEEEADELQAFLKKEFGRIDGEW